MNNQLIEIGGLLFFSGMLISAVGMMLVLAGS